MNLPYYCNDCKEIIADISNNPFYCETCLQNLPKTFICENCKESGEHEDDGHYLIKDIGIYYPEAPAESLCKDCAYDCIFTEKLRKY